MTATDPAKPIQDIWSRVRAIADGDVPRPSWDLGSCHWRGSGTFRWFVPATEEEVQRVEERLEYPLPVDLRHLYLEVADGGTGLGPVEVFYGTAALGQTPADVGWQPDPELEPTPETGPDTTGEHLAQQRPWQLQLHPRIKEALVRHPGSYVIVNTLPQGLLRIGGGHSDGDMAIDAETGCVYHIGYWGAVPDAIAEDAAYEPTQPELWYVELDAPSLSVWFARWLDNAWYGSPSFHSELSPTMVETDDLPDPAVVWRGLYRFGPGWNLEYEDTDLAHDAAHAIYWTYVEDAGREDVAHENNPEGDEDDNWFADQQ